MRLFFPKKKEAPPQVDMPTAIQKNREAIETLEKRQTHLEKRCLNLTEEARSRIRQKDSQGAKLALKRKKMLEGELNQLGNARLTLEQQINTLESQQTQQMAVLALSHGIEAQRNLNQQLNITSIDRLMDDLQEQQDLQQEVAQVLSQGSPMMDEDVLLAELGELEAEELEQQLANAEKVPTGVIGATPVAPITASDTPSQVPAVATSSGLEAVSISELSDEEQLKKLTAELA